MIQSKPINLPNRKKQLGGKRLDKDEKTKQNKTITNFLREIDNIVSMRQEQDVMKNKYAGNQDFLEIFFFF